MRIFRAAILTIGFILCTSVIWAGTLATDEQIVRLKEDTTSGKFQVSKTRLKEIVSTYGDAPTITDTDKKVTYDYGDIIFEFDKIRYMRRWSYDSSKKPVYTDVIKDLRHDLEAEFLVGDNITLAKIRKDYEDPTEQKEMGNDGEFSVYYYGDIKLTFENYFVLKSWKTLKAKETKAKPKPEPASSEKKPAEVGSVESKSAPVESKAAPAEAKPADKK